MPIRYIAPRSFSWPGIFFEIPESPFELISLFGNAYQPGELE